MSALALVVVIRHEEGDPAPGGRLLGLLGDARCRFRGEPSDVDDHLVGHPSELNAALQPEPFHLREFGTSCGRSASGAGGDRETGNDALLRTDAAMFVLLVRL